MAKRTQSSGKITPTTKGAQTSVQGRPRTMPWVAPAPKAAGANLEEGLYSRSDQVPTTGRHGLRTPESIAAATARMHGVAPNERELDELGDSPFGLGHEEQGQSASEQEPEPLADVRFVAVEDVQRMVQEEIAEYARLMGKTPIAAAASPTSVPAPPQPKPTTELVTAAISPEDVDRLWDWIRQEPQSALAFFGIQPKNSLHLHSIFAAMGDAERQGVGLVRSIYLESPQGKEHVGFGLLSPILGVEKLAVVHLFLSPSRRGYLPHLTAALLELTAQLLPGFKFAIIPKDEAQTRLYGQVLKPLGFTTHVMFVR